MKFRKPLLSKESADVRDEYSTLKALQLFPPLIHTFQFSSVGADVQQTFAAVKDLFDQVPIFIRMLLVVLMSSAEPERHISGLSQPVLYRLISKLSVKRLQDMGQLLMCHYDKT